jgi:hypothetical protein
MSEIEKVPSTREPVEHYRDVLRQLKELFGGVELPPPLDDDLADNEDPSWEYVQLRDLRPYDKGVHLRVMVTTVGAVNAAKTGNLVYEFKCADVTGIMLLVLYDQVGQSVRLMDVLQINYGFVTMFRGTMRLACKVGHVRRIGRFDLPAVKFSPNYSKVRWYVPNADTPHAMAPEPASLQEAQQDSDDENFK